MKIAILTGGGDAPGLNPVIRSVVKVAKENQVEMIGIKKGWASYKIPLEKLLDNYDEEIRFPILLSIVHENKGG